jgi:hypothetical protein
MKKIKYILISSIIFFTLNCNLKTTEPIPQFIKIQFHYGFKNELNTFTGIYQKDLVKDGITRTGFYLTDSEQNQIVQKIQSVDFFSFPDTIRIIPKDGFTYTIEPDPGVQFLKIEYNGKMKSVYWFHPLPGDNSFVPVLKELTDFIQKIIEAKPEYKKLPAASGGRN